MVAAPTSCQLVGTSWSVSHATSSAMSRIGRVRGPLHGVALLIKDNIDTADHMTTTAGSLAHEGSIAARDAFLVEVFGRHVTWVPVCPEVEMGLGVPRETMRLERCGQEIRLVTPKTGADHTDLLDGTRMRVLRKSVDLRRLALGEEEILLGPRLRAAHQLHEQLAFFNDAFLVK